MELVSLKEMSIKTKIAILSELGYKSDGVFVFHANGEKYLDKYTNAEVKLENMAIVPGSIIFLNEDSGGLLRYIEEHSDEL
jgi:hypothetical protein